MRKYMLVITFGNKNYKFIENKMIETGFTLNPLLEAYSGINKKVGKLFKSGGFKANKVYGDEILAYFEECVKMGLHRSSKAFAALTRVLNANSNIDRVQLLKSISNNRVMYGRNFSRDPYIKMLTFDAKNIK